MTVIPAPATRAGRCLPARAGRPNSAGMRLLPIVVLLVVTACARGGGWPSLARRPIEGLPVPAAPGRSCAAGPTPSCGPTTPIATPGVPPPPTAPVAIDDVPAKLAVIDRDLTDAATRLAAQRTAAAAAATAARGAATGSAAWTTAQLELTALDRIGNQIGDLRERLDKVAGTLAAASAGGGDVAVPLGATGRLIARATALQADYDTAAAALR